MLQKGSAAKGPDMENIATLPSSPRLLDQVRDRLRVKHYSLRTETAYVDWIKRFILFHGKRHPRQMQAAEVEAFLTHLAVGRNVAASTQGARGASLSLPRGAGGGVAVAE
jgi:hypothetical protein